MSDRMARVLSPLLLCLPLCGLAQTPATEAVGERNLLGIEKATLDAPIPADRPKFGDNVRPVPKGWFAAEGGFRFDARQGGGEGYAVPVGFLLRAGLTDQIEARVALPSYTWNEPGADGVSNVQAGFKIRVREESDYLPALSLLPVVGLPVGDSDVSSDRVEPQLRLAWAKSLSDNFGIGGNANIAQRETANTGNLDTETALSISGAYSFTDAVSSYLGYYTILPEADRRDTHAMETGVSYLANRRTQLDAFVGSGLNDATADVYLGFGIARLF